MFEKPAHKKPFERAAQQRKQREEQLAAQQQEHQSDGQAKQEFSKAVEELQQHGRKITVVGVAIYPRRPETYIIAGTYKAKNDGNIEPAAIRDRSLCQLPGQCAPAGGVFNAATGPAVAWRVLAETISHTAGANGKTASWTVEEASRIFGPYAKGFTENQQLSAARAHQLLGWSPRGLPILNDLEWGSYRTRVA